MGIGYIGYNWYNLEPKFKKWLFAGIENTRINTNVEKKRELTRISVKNYLSDFRHFIGWLTLHLSSQQHISINFNESRFISLINRQTIKNYKSYLVENNIPVKTINRRLSTLRKFCSFCISQGWLKENPAKRVSNVGADFMSARKTGKHEGLPLQNDILQQFHQDLLKENFDKKTITSYLDDIREFLSI
jgi:site-specific recombinase XerD